MRLNFSASGEDEIREGIRRIGEVVSEQVELYETITGEHRVPPPAPDELADEPGGRASVPMPRRDDEGRGPQGRELARARGLAALGGARRGRARARSATRWSAIDVGQDLVAAPPRRATRRRLHRPARARRRGRHRPGAARDPRSALHGPGGARPARSAWTRSPPSTRCARPGIPTPDWAAFNATAFRELGAADTLEEIEARLGFPLVVKPASQGSSLGVEFAAGRGRGAGGAGRRLQLRRPGAARALRRGAASWRSACSTARPCPVVEAIPREEDFFNFEARYEIGRTDYVCPAELGAEEAPVPGARDADLRDARLQRLRARRPDARRRGSRRSWR